jgi:hypothetical protein
LPPDLSGKTSIVPIITKLDPGQYIAVCFMPKGGKKNGTPHWKLGMVSEFAVQEG